MAFHVEVIYPREFRAKHETACPWYSAYRAGTGEKWDARPHGPEEWEETFEFGTLQDAKKFADYTAEQFRKWPDTCQGDLFVIRILREDVKTEEVRLEGTIGSNKPS